MAKGSFKGLYTFEEVAKIYEMSHSNIRKMVQANKFKEGKEIKKFGKTWIITEEAVRAHFGDKIDVYLNQVKMEKEQSLSGKKSGVKAKGRKNKANDLSSSDDLSSVEKLKYIEVDESKVLTSFSFSSDT
ncbi:MAG: helix-turn-helix domain-containing protein [Paraclostridium sp.]